MKTAGVVFDFYDDVSGSQLKTVFPSSEDLPEIVKTAHILSPEEHEILRDEAYALVMKNDSAVLRKFACVDAGNTLLSAIYFLQNAERLPEGAQKIAQANIESFCQDFGLDFEKIAKSIRQKDDESKKPVSGMARTRDPNRQPLVGDEADWASRTNILSVSGGGDSGKVIPTAMSMKTAAAKTPKKEKKKGENVNYLKDFDRLNPEYAEMRKKKHAGIVDVTGQAPVIKAEKRASARTALNGRYALDSMGDVLEAINYFSDYVYEMAPADRHEFAIKTAARADELGLEVPELMQRYGATGYAPDVDSHLANRRAVAPDYTEMWDALEEKRASIEPLIFADLLGKADEVAGLNWYYGGEVQDPYYATFGSWGNEKKADADWGWENGAVSVNAEQLKSLAEQKERLAEKFDSYLVDGFAKDPIAIFDSLPAHHKAILASMASGDTTDAPSDSNSISE